MLQLFLDLILTLYHDSCVQWRRWNTLETRSQLNLVQTEFMLNIWSELKNEGHPLGVQVMLLHDAVGEKIQAFFGGESQGSFRGIVLHCRIVAEAIATVGLGMLMSVIQTCINMT